MPRRVFNTVVMLSVFMASVCWAAAPSLIIPPTTGLTTVEINWTSVPTSTDVGCAETIWLTHMAFSTAGTARTITVLDAQGSPVTWATAVPLTANQITIITFPQDGIRNQGGFSLSASGAGVVYQFRGKVRR